MTNRTIRRGLRLVVSIALIVLAGPGTHTACGQGAPAIPDPITTTELLAYADLMDLSDSQRLAMGDMLDEYGRQFERLRDNEIANFLDQLMTLAEQFIPSGMRIPERERLEEILDLYERLLPRIEAADRALFTQIESICSEEQILAAERCKVLRTIAIHDEIVIEGPFSELNEGSRPRLTTMIRELELDAATRNQVDPILRSYETALLGELRRLHDVIRKTLTRALDIIDELGFREMDTAALMQYFENEGNQLSLMDRYDEESKPLQAQLHDVAKLNEQTFRRILRLLSPDDQERLREQFFEQAYDRAYRGPGAWRMRYVQAERLEGLDEDRRALIRSERARLVLADDDICDKIADDLSRWREYRTAQQMDEDGLGKWRELRDDRTRLHEQAEQRLIDILGPEDAERFARAQGGTTEAAVTSHTVLMSTDVGTGAATVTVRGPNTTNSGLPGRMNGPDRDRLARATDHDGDAVLQSLFDDYRSNYDVAVDSIEGELQAAREIEDHVRRDKELESIQNAARERLAALDEEFFEMVAVLLTTEEATAHAERLRKLRARDRQRTSGRGFWSQSEGEAGVDLVALVYEKIGEPGALSGELGLTLDAYAADAEGNLNSRAAAAAEIARRMAMMERIRQRETDDAATQERLAQTMQERWMEAINEVRRADRAQAQTNRQYMQQVLAGLPEEARWSTEFAYRVEAYPDVYRESLGIESAYTSALDLPDLVESQRVRIAEELTEYRERFRTLSDRMIELRQARDDMDFDFMPDRSMMERELELQRLRFHRRELGERASFDLRMLLDPHQRQAVGWRSEG